MKRNPLKNKRRASIKPKRKGPGYRLHKPTGQGFVELNGRRHYCGRYDLPESQAKAHRLIAQWYASGRKLDEREVVEAKVALVADDRITVEEVAARFWKDAQRRYVNPDGSPSMELPHYKTVLAIVRNLHGPTPAADFGPNALRLVRESMIERGWTRRYITQQVGRVRRVFTWAVAHEMTDPNIVAALAAVEGLRYGERGVAEGRKVKPVPLAYVEAVRRQVASPVAALIDLQLLTGARPGELVTMRPRDLNTSSEVWIYTPKQHKNIHRGHDRTIYLGPKAQAVLAPFLNRPLDAFCFSPAEAEVERRGEQRRKRKTPVWPSHAARYARQRRNDPQWKPGERYTTETYRGAIEHGVTAANRAEAKHAADCNTEPMEIVRWTPHQLRHNAATMIRREYGIEAARVILGHRSPAITETYAELDTARAVSVVRKVG